MIISTQRIATVLNMLPFVRWDRTVTAPVEGENEQTVVYGWIDRADGRADFVVVTFVSWDDSVGFTTSSAARSREITRLLVGPDAEHNDCVPVAQVLGGRVRHV